MPDRRVLRPLSLQFMLVAVLSAVVIASIFSTWGRAQDHEQERETSRLLAILFDSGRVVVGMNQELINDASKGDKGFTPAVFETQLLAVFEQRTGINLSHSSEKIPAMARPLLDRLLEESKKTIESYQTPINIPGLRYKGLIPATFGTETAKRFQSWSGIYLRQVAPEKFLRNSKNKPDAYEASVLNALAEQVPGNGASQPKWEVTESGQNLRLMLPLYYSKACLDCHGEPKGQRDISGYPREGGKEGDLGGAISVKLPLTPLSR
jgi:general secretion pathway protein A